MLLLSITAFLWLWTITSLYLSELIRIILLLPFCNDLNNIWILANLRNHSFGPQYICNELHTIPVSEEKQHQSLWDWKQFTSLHLGKLCKFRGSTYSSERLFIIQGHNSYNWILKERNVNATNTTCQSVFPLSLSFSAFLQSLLSNLIPSRQTSFALACACFVLLCLPFGFDLAESVHSQPSGSGGRSVRGPKPCSNYDGFITAASPLFSPAPYFMPVPWKPCCCFFISTDFLYSLVQCMWKQDAGIVQ